MTWTTRAKLKLQCNSIPVSSISIFVCVRKLGYQSKTKSGSINFYFCSTKRKIGFFFYFSQAKWSNFLYTQNWMELSVSEQIIADEIRALLNYERKQKRKEKKKWSFVSRITSWFIKWKHRKTKENKDAENKKIRINLCLFKSFLFSSYVSQFFIFLLGFLC